MSQEISKDSHATVFLVSGELDKAIAAFEVALGFAAMGVKVEMWFILYGVNSIKKPRGFLDSLKALLSPVSSAPGRNPETDMALQRLIPFLNSSTSSSLPLSQLNYFGIGRRLVHEVMRHKGAPSLTAMVEEAKKMGIGFNICQPCVDVLMLDIKDELLVDAEVKGVSSYVLDTMKSQFNATF